MPTEKPPIILVNEHYYTKSFLTTVSPPSRTASDYPAVQLRFGRGTTQPVMCTKLELGYFVLSTADGKIYAWDGTAWKETNLTALP